MTLGVDGCTCKCTCQSSIDVRPTWLYRAYSDIGELLYIGITVNPKLRMKQHHKSKHGRRWTEITATVTFELYGYRRAAHIAEQRAIAAEKPSYNGISDERLLRFEGPLPEIQETETKRYGKWSW